MAKHQGKIIAPANLNIQPHEMATARALADTGLDIEFIRRTWGNRVTSADVIINGVAWEIKSPIAGDKKGLERNLRKASKQSPNVIIDSQRIKGTSDEHIERVLRSLKPHIKAIRRLLFLNRKGCIIDI